MDRAAFICRVISPGTTSDLNMKAVGFYETSVTVHQSTWPTIQHSYDLHVQQLILSTVAPCVPTPYAATIRQFRPSLHKSMFTWTSRIHSDVSQCSFWFSVLLLLLLSSSLLFFSFRPFPLSAIRLPQKAYTDKH